MKPAINNKNETTGFAINPDIDRITSSTLIRVYIFGKIYNTEEIVGAYIDIVLKP